MKRKLASTPSVSATKPRKLDYCDTPPRLDANGKAIWPAPQEQIEAARKILRECACANKKTLIVPDKDADGLSAGVIVHRTLVKLGLAPELLDVHLVGKGSNIHESNERDAMKAKEPEYVIVLDQGSREGKSVIDSDTAKCLIIDHHFSEQFPEGATVVSGCNSPPVPTSALMAYEICKDLHKDIAKECGYLCAIGTHGDLGNTLKWAPPFPDMTEIFKQHSKKIINDCVSYLNAPRRTATYDVVTAWKALLEAENPKTILTNERLESARREINEEVENRTHIPPKFSKDGKIAVLKIESEAQVHPVIATRWASHLKSKYLEIVLCANYGYLPGKVNFSCRVARCAREKDPPVNIIETLKSVARLDDGDLVARLGSNFARGHKEASGGVVSLAEFEELCALMQVGEKSDEAIAKEEAKKAGANGGGTQKNNLNNYFTKKVT